MDGRTSRWTDEQAAVFDAVAAGKSGAIRAVAGAGKTTTLLEAAARAGEGRRFLMLTYNRRLCAATAGRVQQDERLRGGRLVAKTYHSAAASLFDVSVTDGGDYDACVDSASQQPRMSARSEPFDTLFVDEAQDLNPRFVRFVLNLVAVSGVRSVVLAGDERQTLYGFKEGDARSTSEVLMDPARFFPPGTGPFLDLRLSTSFRVPRCVADFVNQELWQAGAQRIATRAPGPDDSIRLLECHPNLFTSADSIAAEVAAVARSPGSGSVAVLGYSDKQRTPAREISNRLRGMDVRVASTEDDPGSSAATAQVTVGTFHSTKGMEWDTVFVIGFDCYYHRATKAFEPHAMDPLYVAVTRATTRLVLVKCARHGLPFRVRAAAFGSRQGAVPWARLERDGGGGGPVTVVAPLNGVCVSREPCKECAHSQPRTVTADALASSLPVAACEDLLARFAPFAAATSREPSAATVAAEGRCLDQGTAALLNRAPSVVLAELVAAVKSGACRNRASSVAASALVRSGLPECAALLLPRIARVAVADDGGAAPSGLLGAGAAWGDVGARKTASVLLAWDAVVRDSTDLVHRARTGGLCMDRVADGAREAADAAAALLRGLCPGQAVEWGATVERCLGPAALLYPCCGAPGPAVVRARVDAMTADAAFVFRRCGDAAVPGERLLALAVTTALAADRRTAGVVDLESGCAWTASALAAGTGDGQAALGQAARAALGCADPLAVARLQLADTERQKRAALDTEEVRERRRLHHAVPAPCPVARQPRPKRRRTDADAGTGGGGGDDTGDQRTTYAERKKMMVTRIGTWLRRHAEFHSPRTFMLVDVADAIGGGEAPRLAAELQLVPGVMVRSGADGETRYEFVPR